MTSYHNEQVSMCSCENRSVHWDSEAERFVETNTEVSFPTQQQQDENADVHEANTSCR